MVKGNRGTVTLLHVIELVQDMPREAFAEFYGALEQQAKADLKTAETPYGAVDLRHKVSYGARVREILAYADQNAVDLIMVQSHPIGPADPARGWNTISYRVAILAQCPVLLVK